MRVVFGCPSCGRGVELRPGDRSHCARCGGQVSLPALEGELSKCLACGGTEIYRHRDFNAKLGMALIAVGAVLCLLLLSFWPLVIAAVLDALLYFTIPDVGICYACKAHHRECDSIEKLPAFDLERHEHHRWQKARAQGRLPPREEPEP